MEKEVKGIEYTMSAAKANVYALIFVIPVVLVTLVPFWAIWGAVSKGAFSLEMILALVVAVVIHELIHGLYWAKCAKGGFKSIKFGIIWHAITPYCHCKEALKVSDYRVGALLPTIILGFIPTILAWITGNYFLLMFGGLLILGGSGDFLVVWMMRKLKGDEMIKDHPHKVGFYIPEEE